ncbi:hypothetical protein D1871_04645 [Nakamurella silvestris]|nr:hypothetical protein D1871_04645 [Nakamurella silvestris]
MTNPVHPLIALPAVVAEAFELVRSETRIQLLNWLNSHPDSQVSDIVEGIGGQRVTTHKHLMALEAVGVVVASRPMGSRARQRVTYRVDVARCREFKAALLAYLPG